jgi:hypothetical protein
MRWIGYDPAFLHLGRLESYHIKLVLLLIQERYTDMTYYDLVDINRTIKVLSLATFGVHIRALFYWAIINI